MSDQVRRVGGWLWSALGWAVTLALVAVIALTVVVPRVTGATPYVVLTGSMRPGMPPGTLVVVRPVDPHRIQVGDVITYQLSSGEPEVVTHRVVEQGVDGRGQPIFRTHGDANPVPDQHWVRPVQVRGERWYYVRHLGVLSGLLTAAQHELLTWAIGLLLLAYAARVLVQELRRRHRQEPARA